MLSAAVLRSHAAHFVVFGLPIAFLIGTVGWQEVRARLRESADGSRGDVAVPARPAASADISDWLWLAVAGLVAAAAIHAAVIREHLHEDVLFGVFFAALTIAQCRLAVVLIRRPDPRTVRSVAIASAWVVALWVVSRTTGLPIGPQPWTPEAFGGLDIASSGAELATVVCCAMHLWVTGDHRRRTVQTQQGLVR